MTAQEFLQEIRAGEVSMIAAVAEILLAIRR